MSNEIQNVNSQSGFIQDSAMLDRVLAVAKLMASSKVSIPDQLKGSEGDCAAIVMQAIQWGMNPFVVAQKTHFIQGKIAYEAQLVAAVCESTGAITKEGFSFEYIGDWSKVQKLGWDIKAEDGLGVKIWATKSGQEEPKYHTLYLTQTAVRNSPLWKVKPDQQIVYLAQKQWARLHTPGAILGVYTPDEFDYEPKDITNKQKDSVYAKVDNETKVNDEIKQSLYEKLKVVAENEGIEGYKSAWSKLSALEKKEIGTKNHEELKGIASNYKVIDVDQSEESLKLTYAEVKDLLIKASSKEELNHAAKLIDGVDINDELDDFYKNRLIELS